MKMSGKLNYLDEPGHLEVTEFFLRDGSVAVTGSSITPKWGCWDASVELPLIGSTYQASNLHAQQNGQRSDPFTLRMRIISRADDGVEIDGIWIEDEFTSRLRGKLTAV